MGKELLQRYRYLSLHIVNGRLRGGSFGRYTYSSSLGSSTVDYAITYLDPSLSEHSQSGNKPLFQTITYQNIPKKTPL